MTLRIATLSACLALLAGLCPAALADQPAAEKSLAQTVEGERYLPIGLTPEEEGQLDLIGRDHRSTAPPPGPARNPGEFEPMTGVIVRYPWGNPLNLLVEYAEDVTLWVIVANSSAQTSAYNDLAGAGCNMSHVSFITASTNSIWTRDYGPWFIVNGNGDQGIVDHVYNRPRPLDDVIPTTIGTAWGIPVYGMSLTTAGGNYMSDGRGIGMSSRLVIDENTSLTPEQIDAMMLSYLGIRQYEKLPYIQTSGIHHIDCWAKLLSPGKILIRSVPSTHTDYARIEANVAYISTLISSWGRPYEIVRVYTPNNEPYTNSLILNDKVFVPMYGTAWDDDALATYQAAMPGYEVLGYTGSWLSDDAIHCRAMGVTDRYMLYIDHVPLFDTASTGTDYRVKALITDMSETSLVADSLVVHWKTASRSWTPVVMTAVAGTDSFYADIPAQPVGTEVAYFISAADNSGRREKHPYVGPADPHTFDVVIDTEAPVVTHTPLADQLASSWPPTASATVTDNIGVAEVVLESWINGARQTDVAMARVPSTYTYEADFPGTAVAGDAVNYRIVARDTATPPHETASPAAATHYFDVIESVDVVIWEPDPSPISGAAIRSILDGLGVSYEYTTAQPSNLAAYDAAFICLGVYSQNYALSTAQANAVVSYLNGGGNVYMEGGDCWAYDSARTIYNPSFGISGVADGSGDLSTVQGQAGTFTAGMSFSYAGGNSYIDHISAAGTGVLIFRNPADSQGCGVANPAAAYKTVGCSFEFGGLVNGASPSTKAELLGEILEFFGISGTAGVPDDGVAGLALRQNSPNPFNPVTTLAFETPADGRVELAVYSAAGRLVATLVDRAVPAGPHAVSWNGLDDAGAPVASGVYFFRLTQNGESVSVKGVMLK